jgi:hypothetical protein
MNQYLETIELRTSGQNREKLESAIEKLLAGLNSDAEQEQIKVYNSRLIESDFCIHHHFEANTSDREGSPLGLRIVSALQEYGLIHHNIWCAMPFQLSKTNQYEEEIEK